MPSTTTSACGRPRVDVAPAVAVLAEDVAGRERVVRAERRVLDERRVRAERRLERVDRGELLVVDRDERGGLLGGVVRLRGDRRDRLAVVLRLAGREHGPVAALRPEARHRLRQVRRGEDQRGRPGARSAAAGVDRADPRPRDVER